MDKIWISISVAIAAGGIWAAYKVRKSRIAAMLAAERPSRRADTPQQSQHGYLADKGAGQRAEAHRYNAPRPAARVGNSSSSSTSQTSNTDYYAHSSMMSFSGTSSASESCASSGSSSTSYLDGSSSDGGCSGGGGD